MNEWSVDFTFRGLADESWLIELQADLDGKGADAAVSADPDAGNWTVSFGAQAAHPLDAMYMAQGGGSTGWALTRSLSPSRC
jgi:hypothetical protein